MPYTGSATCARTARAAELDPLYALSLAACARHLFMARHRSLFGRRATAERRGWHDAKGLSVATAAGVIDRGLAATREIALGDVVFPVPA